MIVAGYQDRVAAILTADLVLHRRQRNLHPAASRRFVDSDQFEGALKNQNVRTKRDSSIFLGPGGIDDHFIALLQSASLFNGEIIECRILLVGNALDQARAESGVAPVENLDR